MYARLHKCSPGLGGVFLGTSMRVFFRYHVLHKSQIPCAYDLASRLKENNIFSSSKFVPCWSTAEMAENGRDIFTESLDVFAIFERANRAVAVVIPLRSHHDGQQSRLVGIVLVH